MDENTEQYAQNEKLKGRPGYFKRLAVVLLAVSITSGGLLQKLTAPILIPWYMEKTYHEEFIYHGINAGNGGRDFIISAAKTPELKFLAEPIGIFPFNYRVQNDYYSSIIYQTVQKELDEAAKKCTSSEKVYLIATRPKTLTKEIKENYSPDQLAAVIHTEEIMKHVWIYGFFFGEKEKSEEMIHDAHEVFKQFYQAGNCDFLVMDTSKHEGMKGILDKEYTDDWEVWGLSGNNFSLEDNSVFFITATWGEFDKEKALQDYNYFRTEYEEIMKRNFKLNHGVEESQ